MENLNAEQVKRGLECCNTIGGCKVCPYSCNGKPTDNGECGEKMSLDALALINTQETEYNELYEVCESYRRELGEVRAETVREMQERLKGRNEVYCINKSDLKVMNFVVDQIAKEMLEGENEN